MTDKKQVLSEESQKYLEALKISENKNKAVITKAFYTKDETSLLSPEQSEKESKQIWFSLSKEEREKRKRYDRSKKKQLIKLRQEQERLLNKLFRKNKCSLID